MTDIKLNLEWDIIDGGDIEFSVSPEGSGRALASFVLSEEEIADALSDDLTMFEQGEPDSIFLDWEMFAENLRYYADQIERLIEEAKLRKKHK